MKTPAAPMSLRQRGIAVITAMLVVTIATVLAVEIAWRSSLDLRRTESLLGWEQARQFGLGAEALAADTIAETLDNQSDGQPVYSRDDDTGLCRDGFQFTLDEETVSGAMAGRICDLQARFNLNNLVGTDGRRNEILMRQFRRLLDAVSVTDDTVDIDPATADVIVESAADWIDPDTTADFNGAEDDSYTSEQPAYRAANFWFISVSELRAVRGVTPEIYAALLPYLAALPVANGQPTALNVNTAPLPVLMSLGDDVTAENAARWISDSGEEPFEDLTDFGTNLVDAELVPYIAYTTRYFELSGVVSIGTARLGMYSLLESNGTAVSPRHRQFDVTDVVPEPREEAGTEEQVSEDPDE